MDECAERNLYPDPKCLHLDFESAVIEAAKEVIGVHIDIKGCFYHLCQSTFRKVQELGFATKYYKDEEFRKQCGMIDALCIPSIAPRRRWNTQLALDALGETIDVQKEDKIKQ